MQRDVYKRLARVEALTSAQKAALPEVLAAAYEHACAARSEEDAAALARQIRNRLLDASDREMSLDRLGLDLSTAAKLIASLTRIFGGEWAVYRQALRDLPAQEGFPFDVVFPTPPGAEKGETAESFYALLC